MPREGLCVHDPLSDLDIVRRRDRVDPIDDRRLRRALDDGSWTRIRPGAFVRSGDWMALTPLLRHRALVREVARTLTVPSIVSGFAAAAEYGIDILGEWPSRIDLTAMATGGGRSGVGIRRHTRDLSTLETEPYFGGHEITTPAQTALDLARAEPFLRAVAIVDQAIWSERPGGPLTTRDEILARLDRDGGHRGDVRARRAILFSEPLAANVRESQSRVVVAQLGFPRPQLQHRRVLRSGRVAYADLWFPGWEHWCEIDGRWKYRDPAFLDGRTPAQAVIDEKNRENEIRREVRAFSRWEATDADTPRAIWDILTGAGLPTAHPRP